MEGAACREQHRQEDRRRQRRGECQPPAQRTPLLSTLVRQIDRRVFGHRLRVEADRADRGGDVVGRGHRGIVGDRTLRGQQVDTRLGDSGNPPCRLLHPGDTGGALHPADREAGGFQVGAEDFLHNRHVNGYMPCRAEGSRRGVRYAFGTIPPGYLPTSMSVSGESEFR